MAATTTTAAARGHVKGQKSVRRRESRDDRWPVGRLVGDSLRELVLRARAHRDGERRQRRAALSKSAIVCRSSGWSLAQRHQPPSRVTCESERGVAYRGRRRLSALGGPSTIVVVGGSGSGRRKKGWSRDQLSGRSNAFVGWRNRTCTCVRVLIDPRRSTTGQPPRQQVSQQASQPAAAAARHRRAAQQSRPPRS